MKFKSYLIALLLLVPSLAVAQINGGPSYNFNISGETISVSATTTSSSGTFVLPQSIAAVDSLISNAGSVTVFVTCGVGSATAVLPGTGSPSAATKSIPVLAGETMTLAKGATFGTCAAITATGTSTVYFSAGVGQ